MALFPFSIADIDDPEHIRVVLYASGRMGHAPLNALLKQTHESITKISQRLDALEQQLKKTDLTNGKHKQDVEEGDKSSIANGGISTDSGGISADSGGISADSGGISADSGGISAGSGGISVGSGGISADSGGISAGSGGISVGSGGISADSGGISAGSGGISTDIDAMNSALSNLMHSIVSGVGYSAPHFDVSKFYDGPKKSKAETS